VITLKPIAGGDSLSRAEISPFGAERRGDLAGSREFCAEFMQIEAADASFGRRTQRGFSLSELLVVVFLIGILSAIAANKIVDSLEKVRLARCQLELRGIQEEVWDAYVENGSFPDPATYWETKWRGRRPGPYFYLVDGDANKGHGNDLDGIDEDNPGASGDKRKGKDIDFVVLCQHDHKHLAEYVYVVDNEPPMIANADNKPGYERFIKWEFGGPGGGGGRGKN
jgi:prepilin-type N-terminal cleavage/methylation domain-containing protein